MHQIVLVKIIMIVGIDIDAGCGQLKADLLRKMKANQCLKDDHSTQI